MLTEKNMRVVVRGGGDLASGVIAKLYHSGFQVVVLECGMPTAIRRTVSFSEAVYQKVVDCMYSANQNLNQLHKFLR